MTQTGTNLQCQPRPSARPALQVLILAFLLPILAGCDSLALSLNGLPIAASENGLQLLLPTPAAAQNGAPTSGFPAEAPVQILQLAGPAANRQSEISGMAWFDDMLILLPQYPDFAKDGSSVLFALPRTQIEAALDGQNNPPLTPLTLTLDDTALRNALPTFGGYEAIAFHGERVFLTIEAWAASGSAGYLVSGWVDRDTAIVHIDPATLVYIQPQTGKINIADEAIVLAGDSLFTLYELNGQAVNAAPVAHRYNLDGLPIADVPFPHIEYRITDATPLDDQGRFWAINFFYPAEGQDVVQPEPLAQQYGEGATHAIQVHVERLIEFTWDGMQILRTETPPIQLQLALLPRNWEGIARLGDRGFLIITDKYPTTALGFVRKPQ